jgi:LacI family transcriptional regulator
MKRATLKDIALLAEVNISTVSRALKDHPDIGTAVRERVKSIAQQLNYHPNLTAVQLRKKQSNVIGLIIPEAYMFFFPSVINGISEVMQKHQYKLLVLQSSEDFEQEIANVQVCFENNVDGLLISLTKKTTHLEHLMEFKVAGSPVVLIDKVLDNNDFDAVVIDDAAGTQVCLEHLVKTGCRRILGVFGNPNLSITQKRLAGFKSFFETPQYQSIDYSFEFADNTFSALNCVKDIYPDFKPDAIFAMTDEIVAGVVPALKQLKVSIPQDCSVICISDGFLPRILDPELTYLHHDGFAHGKLAATHLIQRIQQKNEDFSSQKLVLDTHLCINDSTIHF